MNTRSMTMPVAPTMIGASTSAPQNGMPRYCSSIQEQNAPIMYWAPCVKLITFIRPKITASPSDSSA